MGDVINFDQKIKLTDAEVTDKAGEQDAETNRLEQLQTFLEALTPEKAIALIGEVPDDPVPIVDLMQPRRHEVDTTTLQTRDKKFDIEAAKDWEYLGLQTYIEQRQAAGTPLSATEQRVLNAITQLTDDGEKAMDAMLGPDRPGGVAIADGVVTVRTFEMEQKIKQRKLELAEAEADPVQIAEFNQLQNQLREVLAQPDWKTETKARLEKYLSDAADHMDFPLHDNPIAFLESAKQLQAAMGNNDPQLEEAIQFYRHKFDLDQESDAVVSLEALRKAQRIENPRFINTDNPWINQAASVEGSYRATVNSVMNLIAEQVVKHRLLGTATDISFEYEF